MVNYDSITIFVVIFVIYAIVAPPLIKLLISNINKNNK